MSGDAIKHTSQAIDNWSFDESLKTKVVEIINPDGTYQNVAGFNIPTYDSIEVSYNDPAFTEVYVFKSGASTVATLTIIFVDATKEKLVSITKT